MAYPYELPTAAEEATRLAEKHTERAKDALALWLVNMFDNIPSEALREDEIAEIRGIADDIITAAYHRAMATILEREQA